MTKAPLGGEKTGPNLTDRDKDGTKRSTLVDAAGVPLAVAGADRHDMKLTQATLEAIAVERPAATEQAAQGLCLDNAYDYDEVRSHVADLDFTAHIRARGEEALA